MQDSSLREDMSMRVKQLLVLALAGGFAFPASATPAWNAMYFGVNAGYAWNGDDATDLTGLSGNAPGFITAGDVASHLPLDAGGFAGGLQLGKNWLVSPTWVLGLEADINYTDLSDTTALPGPTDASRIMTTVQELNWLGTVRARAGVLIEASVLAYATGGFAFGDGDLSTALTRIPSCVGNNCQNGSISESLTGWTLGAGAEFAVASNWTMKVEYLYYDLGEASHLMTDPAFPATVFRADAEFTGSVARLGLNFAF
jgi:outer membrane immunogenic protein